ncbi:MAG: radical SAM protein, partial [Oscillospiraceae bacterium]|nr:radical SAM protein [Oscillospiraceae bacterium]
MRDKCGREINYMRISVTDLCNLRCRYCMPERGADKREHSEILRVEEILEITAAAAELGISKVRITGGEPLVRRGVLDICRGISELAGVSELTLTTNGILLEQFARELK